MYATVLFLQRVIRANYLVQLKYINTEAESQISKQKGLGAGQCVEKDR